MYFPKSSETYFGEQRGSAPPYPPNHPKKEDSQPRKDSGKAEVVTVNAPIE